ncbi:hypothetical protein, partial [Endothiovibrio diazotrophicus]
NINSAIATLKAASLDSEENRSNMSNLFEYACLELAEQWARINFNGRDYSIDYRSHEPIDITVSVGKLHYGRIPGSTPISKHDRQQLELHFIECKLYGRKLSLEVLGKPYLFAIRYRPTSLTIASNQPPSADAVKFAGWLSCDIQFGIDIYHWNPFDLLGNADLPTEPNHDLKMVGHSYDKEYLRRIRLEDWTISKDELFAKFIMARLGENETKHMDIAYGDIFSIHVILENPSTNRIIESANLTLSSGGEEKVIVKFSVKKIGNIAVELLCTVNGKAFSPNTIYSSATIGVISSSGRHVLPFGPEFPALHSLERIPELPDLRPHLANEIDIYWRSLGEKKPILIVEGEGGAGKTYLCNGIAKITKNRGGHVAQISLSLDTQASFISELLWVLIPSETRCALQSYEQHELTENILEALFVNYKSRKVDKAVIKLLVKLLIFGEWPENNAEIAMQHVARLMIGSGKPVIFSIANCHRIPDGPAQALRILLASLEEERWGNIRFILEARNTEEDIGDTWGELKSWINDNLERRAHNIMLQPITTIDIANAVESIINTQDKRAAAEIIANKSGGNPLYISNLLRSLYDEKIIKYMDSSPKLHEHKYILESIAELRDYIAPLPNDVKGLLVARIGITH